MSKALTKSQIAGAIAEARINAARDANLNGFARNGRKSNTTVGLQVEAWW